MAGQVRCQIFLVTGRTSTVSCWLACDWPPVMDRSWLAALWSGLAPPAMNKAVLAAPAQEQGLL